MKIDNFFAELKRRNVYKIAVAYAVVGWLVMQVAATVVPALHLSDAITSAVVILVFLGFPIALVLAWAFEITPEGVKLESEVSPNESITRKTGRRIVKLTIVVAIFAAGLFAFRFFWPRLTNVSVPVSSLSLIPQKSVAVLPLSNESGEKDQQYFSDGLSEDLITALSQFSGLKVINRDSSFRFRDSKESVRVIGDQLGVAHLLEGSVQKVGDAVRVSAELVNVSDGSTLWSQHYDRPYKKLFALQDDITKAVAGALKAKLLEGTDNTATEQTDRPPSGNLAAYDSFQQGQFYFQQGSEEGFRRAIKQFAEAARLDPNYAAAYAAAAETWVELAGYYFGDADMSFAYAQAGMAANTSIRLDPNLAAAHLANSSVLVNADGDWNGWQAEARRALELAPRSAEARFQLSTAEAGLGHVHSAVELVRQALALNALNGYWQSWFATYLSSLGQLDEAEVASHKAVELLPDRVMSQVTLTIVEIQRGNAVAALAAARHTAAGLNQDFATTLALQIGPHPSAAAAALKDLVAKHGHDSAYAYLIADVYALHRDPNNTFQWLDRAWVNHRGVDIQYLLYDPFILRYKDDPRFAVFCRKVGLPTTTDAKAMP